MIPGGGWLLLVALAVPVVLNGAKPLVKKVGKGLKNLGERLMDEATETAAQPEAPTAEPADATPKPKAATRKTAATKAKPKPRTRSAAQPKEPKSNES